jgi:prophage antirepressor-like protein
MAAFSEEKKATKVAKYLQTMANKGEEAIERRTEKTKAIMAKKTKEEHDAMTTKMSQVKKLNNAKRMELVLAEFLNSETPIERMAEIAVSSYRSRMKANISDAQTALQNAVMELVPPLRKKAKTLREDITASERTKAIRMLCWQGLTLPPRCKKSAEADDDSGCDLTASHSGAVESQEAATA